MIDNVQVLKPSRSASCGSIVVCLACEQKSKLAWRETRQPGTIEKYHTVKQLG